MTQRQRPFPGI